MFITIVGINAYLGISVYRVGREFYLEKDLDNSYDDEAISVKNQDGVTVGYVANSVRTVASGTRSAGRVYDVMVDKQKTVVKFIVGNSVIAELVD